MLMRIAPSRSELVLERPVTPSQKAAPANATSGPLLRKPSYIPTPEGSLRKPKQKSSKKVTFDSPTMLLEICQKGLTPDHSLSYFESLLNQVQLDQIFSPQKNMSPLHVACSYGHLEITKLLLRQPGTRVNLIDSEGWTPLHCACAEGHLSILKLLGKCGPLGNNLEIFDYAVKDGPVNLEARTFDGETPVEVALEDKSDQVKRCLKGASTLC